MDGPIKGRRELGIGLEGARRLQVVFVWNGKEIPEAIIILSADSVERVRGDTGNSSDAITKSEDNTKDRPGRKAQVTRGFKPSVLQMFYIF